MILLLAMLACGTGGDAPILIPAPRDARTEHGNPMPQAGTTPDNESWQRVSDALAAMFAEAGEGPLVVLTRDTSESLPPQGYRLRVTPSRVALAASDAAGAWYGAMTVRQLLRQGALATLFVEDWPEFPVRGFLLDVSRDRVPSMATLKELVVTLSELKYNQLQLYMEHTFAYADHREVWEGASPFTADEIRMLDAWCARHFIELVPCQNSLAHMERWLEHPRYRPLAEVFSNPTCLSPADPEGGAFMGKLFDELLPAFSSPKFNICCDEAWQVGTGRSAEAVAERGVTQVYFDYLMDLRRRARKHVDEVLFWGDMLAPFHVEPDEERGFYRPLPRDPSPLLREIPEDMTALVWGYRPDDPFDAMAREYAEAGVRFYVCPGTSAWCSLLGRHDRMVGNVRAAVDAAHKNGAAGILLCDWNWRGWDPLTVSWPGIAYAAGMSWAPAKNENMDLTRGLNTHIFKDPSGALGTALCMLGNLYQLPDARPGRSCVNLPFHIRPLLDPKGSLPPNLTPDGLREAIETIDTQLMALSRADASAPGLACSDLTTQARMARHLFRLLLLRATESKEIGELAPETRRGLAAELAPLIEVYEAAWHATNRPGGLGRSIAPMQALLRAYGGE